MRKLAAVVGMVAALLGGLWFLQGTGIVLLGPILCFADCDPVQGPSLGWAVAGLAMLVAGAVGIRYSMQGHARG